MPERFDDMLDSLRGDAGRLDWKDPAAVRQRGARRTYQQAAVAGLAALLVIGIGVGTRWTLVGADTPAPPGTTASPSPKESTTEAETGDDKASQAGQFPASAFLQPSEIGPGYRVGAPDGLEDGWFLTHFWYNECGSADWQFAAGEGEYGVQALAPPVERSDTYVLQRIDRHKTDVGETWMRNLRDTIAKCRQMTGTSGESTTRLTVLDNGFAADDAILVRATGKDYEGKAWTEHTVFIRRGDVITEIKFDPKISQDQIRAIVAKAEARLCHATKDC